MKFRKKFRGYDPYEVDRYLQEHAEKESKIRASQKERIDQLADENYVLRQELKGYRSDEKAIAQSLIESQNLAKEVKFNAEVYADVVLHRAKTFYATWRAYSQTLVSSLSKEEVAAFNALHKKIENLINAYEGKDVDYEMSQLDENKAAGEADATEADSEGVMNELAAKSADMIEKAREAKRQKKESKISFVESKRDSDDEEELLELVFPVNDAHEPLAQQEDVAAAQGQAEPVAELASEQTEDKPAEQISELVNPVKKVESAAGQSIDLLEILKPEQSLEDICADLGLIKTRKK